MRCVPTSVLAMLSTVTEWLLYRLNVCELPAADHDRWVVTAVYVIAYRCCFVMFYERAPQHCTLFTMRDSTLDRALIVIGTLTQRVIIAVTFDIRASVH